jgi:predicted amidophosphoribosyltransferase
MIPPLWSALVDLVLPTDCAGCATAGVVLCPGCAAALAAAPPTTVQPWPRPPGLPAVTAAGEYAGPLRAAILGYKERGRHTLAGVLGDRLAEAVHAATGWAPVLLIPVPATAAAARRRRNDHVARLARRAARTLRRGGCAAAVAYPLRARPRPDSAALSAADRFAAAAVGFAVRASRVPAVRAAAASGAALVLVDDVLTTGATLAAAAERLRGAGLGVSAAAVLAATRRRVA